MRLGFPFLLALLLTCGCVSPQKPSLREADNIPLAPGDCIAILIEPLSADGVDELTKFFQLDSTGDVSLMYVGKIHLADLTPKQAARRVHEAYVPKYYYALHVT